jgi:Exo-beta-D-glucosaminidase Ig-fold domain
MPAGRFSRPTRFRRRRSNQGYRGFHRRPEKPLWHSAHTGEGICRLHRAQKPAAGDAAGIHKVRDEGTEQIAHVTLENRGKALVFFVRLKATEGQGGEEILPVIRQDNYFSLLPGERREITARYSIPSRPGKVVIEVEGWNVARAFSGPNS